MSDFPNGTASAIERTLECAASVVLPQVRRASTSASSRGTVIHEYARAVLVGTARETALAAVPAEWRDTCAHLDFSKLGGDLSDVRCEMAYAYDVVARTARELGSNIGRDYGRFAITATEIPGSDDIEGMRIDGVPVALDIKTGFERVTACSENAQIMFFALVLMLRTGADEVEGRIAYVREDGSVSIDAHTFSRFDLETFADALEDGHASINAARRVFLAGGAPAVTEGSHCKYCASMSACPAYVSLARTMATDVDSIAGKLETLTDEQAGAAWAKAKAVESLLERVLDALKARARQSPLPTPGGKLVKAIPMKGRESFNHGAAIDMLRTKGASPEEIRGLYRIGEPGEQVREVAAPKLLGAARKRTAA